VTTDDFAYIREQLEPKNFEALIIDCTRYPQETIDLIHTIREVDLYFSLKIYIASPKPSRDYAFNLIKAGIDGFIVKPFNQSKFNTLFNSLVESSFTGDRRRYIRIKPDVSDNACIQAVSPYTGLPVEMEIINLSLGGIAALISSENISPKKQAFRKNDVIRNCKLYLRNTVVVAKTMVVVMIKGRIGFRFIDLEENSKNILCNYIFDSLDLEE